MKQLVLGIDVGGTNVKLGVITPGGKIIAKTTLNTKSCSRNKNRLINAIVEASQSLIAQKGLQFKDFLGMGIGLPGLINPSTGVVKFLPNIPGWRDVPLKSILKKKLRVSTFIENDVNLITLGEWKFGAGRGVKNLICMTLGTGVGSGLILNNALYRGEGYVAGELGHMPLNESGPSCSCGGFGCFERYVGNRYLQAKAAKIFNKKNITLEDLHQLAVGGNRRAIRFWEEAGVHIGNALTGVVNLLNPTHIIIGGGVANSYKYLAGGIKTTIKRRAMKVQAAMVKIVKAKCGSDAGIIGAQVLVTEQNPR